MALSQYHFISLAVLNSVSKEYFSTGVLFCNNLYIYIVFSTLKAFEKTSRQPYQQLTPDIKETQEGDC